MIANHKGEIPFVILIIPFLLGIGVALNYARFADTDWLVIIAFALSTVFITLNIAYKKFNVYKIRWVGGVLITCILFLFGWISVAGYSELNRADHFSKTQSQYLVVKINNEPVLKNGLLRFTVSVEESISNKIKAPTSGTLLITLKDSTARNLYYGDELLIPAKYTAVEPPYNPAEFNYKQYLANKNIYYQQFLFQGQYRVLAHDAGNPVIAYSLRLRQRLIEKLKTNMHDPAAIAVASTIILGYRADLSSDVLQAYQNTGTVYVLTVSGAQVAVIYFMLSFSLAFLNRYKYGRLVKAVIIIGFIWYYALLTGLSPAVCRAVVVVGMVVVGRTFNRYINSLNILAISAFALLLYDPYYITEVGFQLAYLAVAGLIIFRPVVYKWLKFKNKVADRIWSVCSVSIAAQVITFPLSAYYFHQFPVYFLVSNLLAVLPVTIIMYTGIIYLLLPQIPVISSGLGYILEHTILLMNTMLNVIEHLPFVSINKIWTTGIECLLLYAIIIALFYFLYDRKAWLLKTCLVCVLLLSIFINLKKINAQQTNSIAFLSLRKHVGIVMKNGDKAVVISDLPDTDKNYKYSIQPYLDSSGVNNVQVYNLKQDIRSAFAAKRYNLIQFRDKKLLICQGQGNDALLDDELRPDYTYITGNARGFVNAINKKHPQQMLVIDGSNSDRLINLLQKQADSCNVKYSVLKRNKSLLIVSN